MIIPARLRSRRAFVFTTVATVLVLVLILFATSETRTLSRTQTQTARVHTMDGYLDNLEADLPRAAYIAGFRSLIAMEEHVSATGQFLPDADVAFKEAFTNGSINQTAYSILDASTFTDFSNRFNSLAIDQGMFANLSVDALTLEQVEPWAVTVRVNLSLLLVDTAGTASFLRERTIVVSVPVTDIKDPLYSIGTQGRAPHPIRKSNLSAPFITLGNDTTTLQQFINGSLYRESSDAPSILKRFEGNLSADVYGIESLVYVPELRNQGLVVDTCKSILDYKYFGPDDTTPNRLIVNTDEDDVWLSDADLVSYDAVGKTVGDKVCT